MIRRAAFLALLATALLAVQGADCLASGAVDHQSMACCRSMKCMPGQISHTCCKASTPSHRQTALPQAYSSLRAPAAGAGTYVALPIWAARSEAASARLALVQHPPPELYTLYSSLLI